MILITIIFIAFFYGLIAIVFLLRLPRGSVFFMHPGSLFVIGQLLYVGGTLPLLDTRDSLDISYLLMFLTTLICFVGGTAVTKFLMPITRNHLTRWNKAPFQRIERSRGVNFLVGSIIVVALIICVWYYNAIGYNIFVASIRSLVLGVDPTFHDVTTARLNAYSGNKYFAPGYVNQFKNILLPLLLLFLLGRFLFLRKRFDLLVAVTLAPFCLVFLLGTGQRFYLFLISLVGAIFSYCHFPKVSGRTLTAAISVTCVLLLGVGTLILGRTLSRVRNIDDAQAVMRETVDRFVLAEQYGGLVGFHYVSGIDPVFGMDWINKLYGLLPGSRERVGRLTIDNTIHALMNGSTRGTAQMSLWSEAWYNFRSLGISLFPFVLGASYQLVFARAVRGPKTLMRALIYMWIAIVLGSWVSGGPDFLLNQGLATVMILNGLVNLFAPYRAVQPAVRRWGPYLEAGAPHSPAMAGS